MRREQGRERSGSGCTKRLVSKWKYSSQRFPCLEHGRLSMFVALPKRTETNMESSNIGGTPLANKIPEACRRLGVGRTSLYALVKAGEIHVIKVGSRTLIPESELQRFVEGQLAARKAG